MRFRLFDWLLKDYDFDPNYKIKINDEKGNEYCLVSLCAQLAKEVEKLENISDGYRYTLKSMELFQLNFKLAKKMLGGLKEEVRENQSLLLKIMKHESETKMFDYTIGPHSGRLYTSVTSQKRTFRKLWNLSNEPVAIVDVGSCQPALLYSL
jgi:hypothetical protein